MRLPLISAALAALCFALPASAQGVKVFGGNGQRANSSMFLFGEGLTATIQVTHGQPIWKDGYTARLDGMKGATHRLGKDMWTTFMTNVPVEIGGAKIAPGFYCVAINIDDKGKFALAMIDATKAMKQSLMPWPPHTWKPDATAPLKLNKDVAEESVEKMTMTLAASEEDPMTGTFTIAWGPHTLTAPLKVHKPEKQ